MSVSDVRRTLRFVPIHCSFLQLNVASEVTKIRCCRNSLIIVIIIIINAAIINVYSKRGRVKPLQLYQRRQFISAPARATVTTSYSKRLKSLASAEM